MYAGLVVSRSCIYVHELSSERVSGEFQQAAFLYVETVNTSVCPDCPSVSLKCSTITQSKNEIICLFN